jgi:hypothetical protein
MRRPLFAALWLSLMTIPLASVQAHSVAGLVAQDRISVFAALSDGGGWLPFDYIPNKTVWSKHTCDRNGNLLPPGWCKGLKRRSGINRLPLSLSP